MPDDAPLPAPIADLDAERAVLAAPLLDPSAWWQLVDRVSATDFYDPRHGLLWEVYGALVGRGEPVDVVTVVAELRARNRLNTAGGAQYVGEVSDTLASAAHCESHARIVRDLARVRAIERAGLAIARAAREYGASAEAYAERALAWLSQAAEGEGTDDAQCSVAAAVDLALSDDEEAVGAPTAHWHLPTVEYVTGGLWPGQLILIGARPGVGKSALALELAIEGAADGAVLFASMEATRVELAQRALARVSGVDASLWKRPADRRRLAAEHPERADALARAANDLHQRGIVFADGGRQSVAQVYVRARKMKARGRLALVVVDYLQLLQEPSDLPRGANREQAVGANARALKLMAMELGVPVVALSQLNREGDSGVPTLAMLRESGSLEQDANTVIFVYPDGDQDKAAPVKRVHLLVAKQRNGLADVGVELVFDRATTAFSETDASERRGFAPARRRRGPAPHGPELAGTPHAPRGGNGGECLPVDPTVVFVGETAPLALAPAVDDGTEGEPW